MEILQKEKQKKYKRMLTLLLLLCLFMGIGFYLYQSNQGKKNNFQEDANSLVGIMPGMSEEEIQKRLNMVVSENMMNITINPKPVFKDGQSGGNLCIENISQNHFDYIVSIKLDKTNKQIYQSGLIRPNHYIQQAKLDKSLSKGKYKANAYFNAYDKNKKLVGTSVVKIMINVLN